jgi:hypothetical protein
LAAELNEKVTVIKVDVDENEETSEVEKIIAMPTFKIYRKGKKEYE